MPAKSRKAKKRRILVTSALPYANGHIHIGHLVEYLQTDMWVRFQKLRGHRCVYVCADDTHGTAISLRAREEGRSEQAVIAEMSEAHQRDFAGFDIAFDHYGSTNSAANEAVCGEIWRALRRDGLVREGEVEQLYDVEKGMFLADRQVRGTCPNPACGAPDQPGDNCSVCTWHYSPVDLIQPVSVISGTKPEIRRAQHLFVETEKMHAFLEQWTQSGTLPPESANYLQNTFLREPLKDWDVSRPAPYFGFEIPDSPGNYWYVWFDAPIGYIGSTAEWCAEQGEKLDDWWRSKDTEIHHFIGKDIQYFHTLFWPVMLKSAGFSLPTKVHIHGFLTVDGEKMSKSKGTFVRASKYLEHLDPSCLRYYYASKLSSRVEDLDLNLDEFVAKTNGDLVGKVINLASRTARFVKDTGLSAQYPEDEGLFQAFAAEGEAIAEDYERGDLGRAMRRIMDLADRANPYIERNAPWELKGEENRERLQAICTVGLNLFRQLALYLAPVLPRLARQCGELLNDPLISWEQSKTPLTGRPVSKFQHMMQRVEPGKVLKVVEESRDQTSSASKPLPAAAPEDSGKWLQDEPLAPQITIEEFAKVDLRVARVLEASEVPEARKLLRLKVSLGGTETRQIFAGIKQAYRPEDLVGQLVVIVANLAPRQMKFGASEGMAVAAGPGNAEVYLLRPDRGAAPGQRVH